MEQWKSLLSIVVIIAGVIALTLCYNIYRESVKDTLYRECLSQQDKIITTAIKANDRFMPSTFCHR